jgi:hypothetical protein
LASLANGGARPTGVSRPSFRSPLRRPLPNKGPRLKGYPTATSAAGFSEAGVEFYEAGEGVFIVSGFGYEFEAAFGIILKPGPGRWPKRRRTGSETLGVD